MRAHEFIVENVITHGDNQFKIQRLEPGDEEYADMKVSVLDDWGNEAGFAKFASDGKDLDPRALRVHDRYRGQGFAKLIYDFMKSKGYRIIRSWDQTDDGAHFWDKNRGEDVRVWEDGYDIKNFNFDTEPYEGWTGEGLIVHAYDGKDEVGHVIFEPTEDDETQWYAVDVEVEEPYQRKGIATQMYNIAKKAAQAQGKIIVRSHTQSQAGKGLWQDKRVWEDVPQPGQSSGHKRSI